MEEHFPPALEPDHWVDRYGDYLYHYTIVRVNDETVARDLIQDTFLAALKSASSFKGDATERTWLTAILKRKIIDFYRRTNSRKGQAEVRMQGFQNEGDSGNLMEEMFPDYMEANAQETLENEELGDAIMYCISKLPPKQAKVFTMKTLEGMDTETICKELGLSASNVWVIIHRARVSLIECLRSKWF